MTSISNLGQTLAQTERIRTLQVQIETLSLQLATGKKTQTYAGLGTDVLTSQRSRANIASLDVYISNITAADRRIQLMSAAIDDFSKQAQNLKSYLVNFPQETNHLVERTETFAGDDPRTTTVIETEYTVTYETAAPSIEFRQLQEFAGKIFDTLGETLKLRDGDRFLFGGSESATIPYNDSGLLDSYMNTLITQWHNGTVPGTAASQTTDLIADLTDRQSTATNPNALTDSTIGYSAALSAGTVDDVFVRVDDGNDLDYTTLANDTAFRDVMMIAGFLKNPNLGPIVDVFIPPNFEELGGAPDIRGVEGATQEEQRENFGRVIQRFIADIDAAIDQLDQLKFSIESTRAQADEIKKSHRFERGILDAVVADVENVDLNQAAVELNAVSTSLDAAFRITARISELSLVNFI